MHANILLLFTAAIWGSAFVAQRLGMDYIGPHTFNGIRFLIGGLALIPLSIWLSQRLAKQTAAGAPPPVSPKSNSVRGLIIGGVIAGCFLFGGAALQQVGLIYTTAGKAGFITSLYIVLVPIAGLALKHNNGPGIWLGAFIALIGLYLLSIKSDWSLDYGDLLVLIGAFFWTGHVLVIGWLAPQYDPLKLSILQFLFCGVLSTAIGLGFEPWDWEGIKLAMPAILYTALMSTAIGYTLQVVAQQKAKPSHAAIILSAEAVFAVAAGWLILDEVLTVRAAMGCVLIMLGMLISQLMPELRFGRRARQAS